MIASVAPLPHNSMGAALFLAVVVAVVFWVALIVAIVRRPRGSRPFPPDDRGDDSIPR